MQCQLRVGLMIECDPGDELWMWRDENIGWWMGRIDARHMQLMGSQVAREEQGRAHSNGIFRRLTSPWNVSAKSWSWRSFAIGADRCWASSLAATDEGACRLGGMLGCRRWVPAMMKMDQENKSADQSRTEKNRKEKNTAQCCASCQRGRQVLLGVQRKDGWSKCRCTEKGEGERGRGG